MVFLAEVVFVEEPDAEARNADKTLSWICFLRRARCQWPRPRTRFQLGSGWTTTSRKESGVEFADGWSAGGEEGVEVKAGHGLEVGEVAVRSGPRFVLLDALVVVPADGQPVALVVEHGSAAFGDVVDLGC